MPLLPLLAAAVSILAMPTAAPAGPIAPVPVTVRVYDGAGLPTAFRDGGLNAAAATLGTAAVDVTWVFCRKADGACAAPASSHELSLRIVHGRALPDTGRGATLPLGDALIDSATGRGILATVYADRVAHLAASAGADVEALLGRAIAHEIGHLLLATTAHARTGVMRPVWTHKELQRFHAADWIFTAADADAIRKRHS